MSIREFIKQNKGELDIHIYRALGDWQQFTYHSKSGYRLNDDERRMWIINDESLYRWAKQCGVRI